MDTLVVLTSLLTLCTSKHGTLLFHIPVSHSSQSVSLDMQGIVKSNKNADQLLLGQVFK